jgi:hypothetical protein
MLFIEAQRKQLIIALWTHCAPHHPELRHIPPMEDERFIDAPNQLGAAYTIGMCHLIGCILLMLLLLMLMLLFIYCLFILFIAYRRVYWRGSVCFS